MGVSGMDLLWMDITFVFLCVCAFKCKTGTKKICLELHLEKNTLPMPISGLYPTWAPSGVEKVMYFPIQPYFFMSINEGVKKS